MRSCIAINCDISCETENLDFIGEGCCQQFDCPQGCKIRDLGLSKSECIAECNISGCFLDVNGFTFNLCSNHNNHCMNTPGSTHKDACIKGCEGYISNHSHYRT